MPNKTISKANQKLIELKRQTPHQQWQFIILKEFIDLFKENKEVLDFINTNYINSSYNILDDNVLLSPEELAQYETNQDNSLETKIHQLLSIKK